ncbi:MAG: FAD-dependent oxidoreductase [Vicinamibacterales bacterium]
MPRPKTVILGGGLSGIAVAQVLAEAGWSPITIIERGVKLGGLAGSFQQGGKFYPLGYHHILHRDRTLLFFLDLIGALPAVRWKAIRMLFEADGALLDLSNPIDFLRFPMSPLDKLRFARLMIRAFTKRDWAEWHDRSAAELVDHWGGPGVRTAIFEPLTRLKFDLPCSDVSAAWMGARLHFREGSAPLGFIPESNWTTVLCDRLTELTSDAKVEILTDSSVQKIHTEGERICAVELADGRTIPGDLFVSTLPTEAYCRMLPTDGTVSNIRYTALVSAICATPQRIDPDFYWLNLTSLDHSACAIFQLSSLNASIGAPGETCINFVTHLGSRDDAFFTRPDDALMEGYARDFETVVGCALEPSWVRIARVPMYSPIFHRGYRNPPVQSATFSNMYFAGNYRTFPSVASTGTALHSGLETGCEILRRYSQRSDILERVASFRLKRMPRE